MKRGLFVIMCAEALERFSFYGIMSTLFVVLKDDFRMTEQYSGIVVHTFCSIYYLCMVVGAIISEVLKNYIKNIVIIGNIIYCIGHILFYGLGYDVAFVYIGLGVICMGCAIFKPVTTALASCQFSFPSQRVEYEKALSWFYASINVGGMVGILMTPWLRVKYGNDIALAFPAVGMIIAAVVMFFGRNIISYTRQFDSEEAKKLGMGEKLSISSIPKETAKVFKVTMAVNALSLMVQTLLYLQDTVIVAQGLRMKKEFGFFALEAPQIIAFNAIFVIIFAPLMAYTINWFKIGFNGRLLFGSFLHCLYVLFFIFIQLTIDAKGKQGIVGVVPILFQIPALCFGAIAEVIINPSAIQYCSTKTKYPIVGVSINMLMCSLANIVILVTYVIAPLDKGPLGSIVVTLIFSLLCILFYFIFSRREFIANSKTAL